MRGKQVAGPIALMDCVEAYAQFSEKGVSVLPAGTVYAYNWREVRHIMLPTTQTSYTGAG